MSQWSSQSDSRPSRIQAAQTKSICSTISHVVFIFVLITVPLGTALYILVLATGAGSIQPVVLHEQEVGPSAAHHHVPDYFQTSPQIYAGPTQTASVQPFLAQTNPVPFGDQPNFAPNQPLQTSLPIANVPNGTSIFQLTGHLSPYSPAPGFGADEFSLPLGTNITSVHVLHRHGSRYPTSYSGVAAFGSKIRNLTQDGRVKWSGRLVFLDSWTYALGAEILTARGRQELFDSGVLHYYNYGDLYNTSIKILARTTTQDRMLKSAEYFMAGFFGLDWTHNATLEPQVELNNHNTSLAGYFQCENSNNFRSTTGSDASRVWQKIYLQDAITRLSAMSDGFDWTVADAYNAQTLCPYETVAYGYSAWCDLFTHDEWQGFEYSIDLMFHGNSGFASPTGRGVGIGYVQEMYARLQHHVYNLAPGATNVNYTLDTMPSTFPVNQSLYFDFSHDTNIMSIITAFGLTQFGGGMPATAINGSRSLVVSHVTPFAARMVWEVINAPQPVKDRRPPRRDAAPADEYDEGPPTQYVHLLLNQRTVPLHISYPQCARRDDGWCDLATFMDILGGTLADAQYEFSCFGNYSAVPYGNVSNGVPITKRDITFGIALGGPAPAT